MFCRLFSITFAAFVLGHFALPATAKDWLVLPANPELAKDKSIVFVTGDDEYKSEESMPMMAHILAEQHGFDCTVLFAINRKTGVIDTSQRDHIPGLEALADADLMVIYTRFRELEDAQCAMIEAYLATGKPVIGIRTSTHAFNFPEGVETSYRHFNYNYEGDDMPGGFGKAILGETWINHWGRHGTEGTRGMFAPGQENHPILTGIKDGEIFGPTDVYTASLPLPEGCQPILLGQVTETLDPTSKPTPNAGQRGVDKNDPMMPVSWIWQRPVGAKGRVFTSTIGGALRGQDDWASAGMRRMFVNACYWTLGIEDAIPAQASVAIPFDPNPYKRGVKPADALSQARESQKTTAAAHEAGEKTILFYGNSMVERLLEHGEMEARLQISQPDAGLMIRSLAWTGDEVGNRLRLEKYANHMKNLIAEWPANTLVLGYGLFESFAGEAGLAAFQQQYRDHLRQLQQVHPGAKLVLLSPIAMEGADEARTAEIALYTKAIADLAAESGGQFIDLFALTSQAYAATDAPLTTGGGIHLNDAGNAIIADAIASTLGATQRTDPAHLKQVALAAAAKQKRVAEVVRPKNAVVYFGVRARPDEYNGEMPRYHEMIQLTEAVVHDLAASPDKAFSEMPIPSLPPMPEGKGRDDGKKTGIIKTVAKNMAEFTVADGYAVNLFASEEEFPELRNPVQIAFDARGRLWVVTMPSFPHTVPGLTPPDKILILEDTDGDGKADTCTPYLEGLDALDGIAFHRDGVIISEQPRLWMTKDTDGDDRADHQTELLRGIDVTDSHHGGMINAGPMGDIIFCDGVFHRSQLETPFGVHRGIDATTYRLDPATGRINSEWQHITPNPWDAHFDRWGQPYQMYGDGGVFDGTSLVWMPRGAYHSYGYAQVATYGKGSGMAITSSPNFPDAYQQGFVSASLLGRYAVNMTAMNFETGMAKKAEHITLLSSPNAAFRPADLEFGMDGALYVSDFCSPIIGHAQHPMRDPHWDHDYGRIWRIVHTEKPLVTDLPKIEGTNPKTLCDLLLHPQDIVRHHARIELRKHGEAGLLVADNWFATSERSDPMALEIAFVAAGLGEPRPALITQLLESENPLYRGAAVHTLRVQSDLYHDHIPDLLAKVAADPHPRVQNQLIGAIAHLRLKSPEIADLLAKINPATKDVEKSLSFLDLGTAPVKERSVPVLTVDPKSELHHWVRYAPDGSGDPVAHSSKKPSGGGEHLYRTFVTVENDQSALLAVSSLALEVRVNGVSKFHQDSFWSADQQIPVDLKTGENALEVILFKGRRGSKQLPPVFLYDPVGNALDGTRYPSDPSTVLATATAYDKAQAERDKTIRIQAAAELQFAQKEITVTAGAPLTLIFENPDVMLHNFLLLKPGTVEKVGALADAMAADPTATERHYVPDSDDILLSSTLLGPGAEETLKFIAPEVPGIYPYICTFPGHWRLMKGELKVVAAPPKPSENHSFETADSVSELSLLPSEMVSGKVTASQKTNNDSLTTLSDGELAKSYGPIFDNGILDGAYCLDLGQPKVIASVTSWSHNLGGKRGAQKIQVYGSNHAKAPGWNFSDAKRFTHLGAASSEGQTQKAFSALSLHPEEAETFGTYRWIIWQVAPVSELDENTAFQELRVEVAGE